MRRAICTFTSSPQKVHLTVHRMIPVRLKKVIALRCCNRIEKKSAKEAKNITDSDRTKVVSPLVDGDVKVVKKILKLLALFRLILITFLIQSDGELSEKKLISRLIKLCGIETAKYF